MKAIPTPFIDMLFILVAFLLLMIAPETKKQQPQQKPISEFIISITWPSDANSDVDGWIMRRGNPDSKTGYSRRENDVFILHNDNTSAIYGQIDGESLPISRETITIERIKADQYLLSLHGFNIRTLDNSVKVQIELCKSNPFQVVFSKEVTVFSGEEVPVASWSIDSDGNIVNGSVITNEGMLIKFL